jgi:hypothetical protein
MVWVAAEFNPWKLDFKQFSLCHIAQTSRDIHSVHAFRRSRFTAMLFSPLSFLAR